MHSVSEADQSTITSPLKYLLELYREGRISLGKMAALLGVSRTEMMGIIKDSKISLNYGVSELDEDIETAKRMGILNEGSQ
jgi:predicted HTH domain antitoxin